MNSGTVQARNQFARTYDVTYTVHKHVMPILTKKSDYSS